MLRVYEQRLTRLQEAGGHEILKGARIGLEKETLRVGPDGGIAQTPHPAALGSALTHPYITTDYSESLLEFITPPFTDLRQTLDFLHDVHQFVYRNVGDEMLWANSMPCVVQGEEGVPIAWYGTSNSGMMKHVYRRGLGYRYGKIMQVIAGVHFNYSLPDAFWPVYQDLEGDGQPLQDFISERYFCLIRNLQRFGWLIPFLFGASPAVCKSFFAGHASRLAEFDNNTYFMPHATSLRLSDIGYTNRQEKKTGLNISYNSMEEYLASLAGALQTPCPAYQAIGVVVDGEYRQLNANLLQIENEYYSTMRPKQVPHGDERPYKALRERGVQYVELRSLDVGVFDPMGVNAPQLHFLEAFLLFCLLQDSPPIDADERRAIDDNQMAVAHRGREPRLSLIHHGKPRPMSEWAMEIVQAMGGICEILDRTTGGRSFTEALHRQSEVIQHPELTPSARIIAEMRRYKEPFFYFAKRWSKQHQNDYMNQPVDEQRMAFFSEEARASRRRQEELEAADDEPFSEYLQHYFQQT
ncbi:MAG: glutamate--cysteine ligase [Gammaproteobacteria bacterium]|nr:glutamate--cysteine ligase [Gammaproteobacteria bacterium]MCP5423478.1 glutamate--cysteine ligase [Gammaproteobacteria bacterium]MCP5458765.1 glutamate--cysteine ligase [Gammaproteobacteria bacterium]